MFNSFLTIVTEAAASIVSDIGFIGLFFVILVYSLTASGFITLIVMTVKRRRRQRRRLTVYNDKVSGNYGSKSGGIMPEAAAAAFSRKSGLSPDAYRRQREAAYHSRNRQGSR